VGGVGGEGRVAREGFVRGIGRALPDTLPRRVRAHARAQMRFQRAEPVNHNDSYGCKRSHTLVVKSCGQIVWSNRVVKSCRQIAWSNRVVKSRGQIACSNRVVKSCGHIVWSNLAVCAMCVPASVRSADAAEPAVGACRRRGSVTAGPRVGGRDVSDAV
jgi:hypothetical protein